MSPLRIYNRIADLFVAALATVMLTLLVPWFALCALICEGRHSAAWTLREYCGLIRDIWRL